MGELDLALVPLVLVDYLSLDFAHAGIGLGFGGMALHHAGHVEVFDDQVLELVDQL